MSRPPFYRPPGSGPLHPVEANSLSQLAKSQAARPAVNKTVAVTTPSAPASAPVNVAAPLRTVGSVVTLDLATGSSSGYLSAADWTTFNAKEPALGSPATDGFALVSTAAGARSWTRASLQAHAIATKTATYAALATDEILLADATGGAFTITLPTPVGITGRAYAVKRINSGANAVTVATAAGTIDGAATVALSSQWQVLRVVSDGANWFGR